MGIGRLITVIAVIWLVWFFLKRYQQHLINRKQADDKNSSHKKSDPISSVKECAVCGVHVPESEALEHDGRYYCSVAHKNSHQKDE